MTTVSASELARRVHSHGLRCEERLASSFLEHWRDRGVAEEVQGRWKLTKRGRAMFGGWAAGIALADEERAA
jgi:hypothetical protein